MLLSKISSDRVFVGKGALTRLDNILPRYKNLLLFNDKDGFHSCGAADYFNQKFNQKLLQGVQGAPWHGGPFRDGFVAEDVFDNATCTCNLHLVPLAEKSPPGSVRYVSYAGKALPIEDIEEKYREVKHNPDVDLIIAVGGGTIMDMAKIISIAYSNRCEKAEEILSDKTLANRIDLIFIPTTAGTGSEATSFAVVYRDKVKISVEHKSLLPTYVVLDPLLLRSLPVPILNSTVLDALAQAIESIWARGSTGESREYSQEAIGSILDNLDKENSIERLSGLQVASHLAGKAINISKTTLPHSISYPITSYFGVPHGIAVFLTLPGVAELNYYTAGDTVQEGVQIGDIQKSFSILFSLFGVDGIEGLKERLMGVMKKLGFSNRLRDYGIGREALSFLADHALTRGRSDNNPRKINRDEVFRLLEEIY